MGLRTNPDRILDNIDRQRSREDEDQTGQDRQAVGRDLETEIPDIDATTPERMRRIFKIVERGYNKAASSIELGKLASHFRAVGDIPNHHARGDVSISIQYIDSPRSDDVGIAPFEIFPDLLVEMKKETKTSRPDVNALKVLRLKMRDGVMAAYKKVWSFDEMNGFLIKPKEWIKGTKMAFAGLKNEKDRAAVILYMNENSNNPLPLK